MDTDYAVIGLNPIARFILDAFSPFLAERAA
jgi:hypothetical protein